jgi:hypothetical protein
MPNITLEINPHVVGAGSYTSMVSSRAFGVSNNTVMTAMELLLRTNARARNGILWDANGDGILSTAESAPDTSTLSPPSRPPRPSPPGRRRVDQLRPGPGTGPLLSGDTRMIQTTPAPPTSADFGLCYQCAAGWHDECVGVPCDCPCAPPKNEADSHLAAAPDLLSVARRLWSALDEVRSRDARWLGPQLRALHEELGAAVRQAEAETALWEPFGSCEWDEIRENIAQHREHLAAGEDGLCDSLADDPEAESHCEE